MTTLLQPALGDAHSRLGSGTTYHTSLLTLSSPGTSQAASMRTPH